MSDKSKKILNRGGLLAIVVGVVAYIAGGGNAEGAARVVTMVAGLAGGALILIREIMD